MYLLDRAREIIKTQIQQGLGKDKQTGKMNLGAAYIRIEYTRSCTSERK